MMELMIRCRIPIYRNKIRNIEKEHVQIEKKKTATQKILNGCF